MRASVCVCVRIQCKLNENDGNILINCQNEKQISADAADVCQRVFLY